MSQETYRVMKLEPLSLHVRMKRTCPEFLVGIASCLFAVCIASACAAIQQVAPTSAVPASAATVASSAGSPPTQPEQHRTFLWTVSSPTATVHLLGSVHVATSDAYPLDPRIESAFERADTLVFEMPMDPTSQVQAAQKLANAGTYPTGDSIDKHVDSQILDLLDQQLKRSGASVDSVRSFRPWLVALVLSLNEMQRLGYRAELGIDMHFADKATKDRKRIMAFETVDEQVALFAGMTEDVQESMLKETLTKLDDLGKEMNRALSFWRTGDLKAMDELLVVPLRRDYPGPYQRLFVERNRRMATSIEGYLKGTGDYLVVVGAGHLVGSEGILELLRGKGYAPVQE